MLKEKKFLNTIILIACVTFFCIVPFMVVSPINSNPSNMRGNILVIEIFAKIFSFFFCANVAVNPKNYVLRLPNYRKTFYCCIAEELGIDVEEHLKETNPESDEHCKHTFSTSWMKGCDYVVCG